MLDAPDGRLAGMDVDRRLRLRPLQNASTDPDPAIAALSRQLDLRRALYAIDAGGSWRSGGEAVLWAAAQIPALRPLVAIVAGSPLRMMVEPGDRWFARRQARFASLAGSFAPAQGVGGREPSGPHRRVEARDRTDR